MSLDDGRTMPRTQSDTKFRNGPLHRQEQQHCRGRGRETGGIPWRMERFLPLRFSSCAFEGTGKSLMCDKNEHWMNDEVSDKNFRNSSDAPGTESRYILLV